MVFLTAAKQIHCISIGKIAKCQLLFLAPCLTPPPLHPDSGIVLEAGKVLVHLLLLRGEKKTFPLYFILLFVGKHLKEIEGLNDKRVCIQSGAVLTDSIEEQPICWGAACFRQRPG